MRGVFLAADPIRELARRARAVAVILFLLPVPLHAQDVGGALEGMVFDPAGALPEARVTISGPSLQGTRVARCDREGRFHFPLLPVGIYEARVDLLGHRDAIISGIRVDLGRTTDLGTVRLEV